MGGAIHEDTRQQVHGGVDKHAAKHGWWAGHGVDVRREKLDFGDYMAYGSNVSVDTKRNVDEIAQNINGKSHARFRRECERARDAGYRLVFLVENELGYENAGDVVRWENTHCAKCHMRARRGNEGGCRPLEPHGKCPRHGTNKPIQGARLYKAMRTMEGRYGVRFEFCRPEDSARRICELLGVDYERD